MVMCHLLDARLVIHVLGIYVLVLVLRHGLAVLLPVQVLQEMEHMGLILLFVVF